MRLLTIRKYEKFVDDTFVIGKVEHSQDLLQHINNQDPHIQFTVEPTIQGSLPFLDTLVTIQPDNTLSTSVYRKPTHTDQYLHWDSNHHITAKQRVYNTLAHRAKTVSSTQHNLEKGTLTHQISPPPLPVPPLGIKPMGTQIHPTPTSSKTNQHHQQQQSC